MREQSIDLARRKSWRINTAPEFARKAAGAVGPHLEPPYKAIVLSIGEKPGIQALEFGTEYALTSDRTTAYAFKIKSKRKGPMSLMAALDVAASVIHGAVKLDVGIPRRGFLRFMVNMLSELPPEADYHVFLDRHADWREKAEAWIKKPLTCSSITPRNMRAGSI